MKKLIMMAAIALLGYNAVAQEIKTIEKPNFEHKTLKDTRVALKNKRFDKLTPEQRAELQVKRLALKLDLSDKQQRKLIDLNDNRFKSFKEDKLGNKNLSEFDKEKKHLESKIEYQRELKKILTKDQLQKWESLKSDRKIHSKNKFEKSGLDKQRFEKSRMEPKNFKHKPHTKLDSVKKA